MRRARMLTVAAAAVLVCGGLLAATADAAPTDPDFHQPADPGREGRIATLTAALANVRASIAAGHPRWGALDLRDVFSYKVDQLWTQGIDGFGTSVAVMEGWKLDGIQQTLDTLDDQIGLPHTTVQTVFPDGPLPAQCPPGMVALHNYGSCDAWGGEL